MRKRCTIGATLIAIAILGTLLITNNKIRSPALAKVTVTALAEENGFDEKMCIRDSFSPDRHPRCGR